MTAKPAREEDWKEYRRCRRQFFLVWLAGVPVVGCITWIGQSIVHTLVPGRITAILWLVLFLLTGGRLQMFPCPRCGETFSRKGWVQYSIFARKCLHCGLKKFALF